MKKILTYIVITVFSLSAASCSDFLNVNPKGEVFDDDMFSDDEGFQDALYGVYSELGTSSELYAGYMLTMAETMSWNFASTHYQLGNLSTCDWKNNGPTGIRKDVWTAAYKAVNHLNNIIIHTEDKNSAVKHLDMYRGEALALRALIHFDLLRYYGAPWWASEQAKKETIPYVKTYSFTVTRYSSYDEVFADVLADLQEAESLLGEDKEFLPASRTNSASGFFDARITHMNLYAVQALIARVYWTRKDLDKAAEYAQKVIDSEKFQFRPLSAFVQADNGTLDLNETIFGFYSESQKTMANLYSLGSTAVSASAALASDALELYSSEASSSRGDYRLSAWFDAADNKMVKMVNRIYYDGSSSYTGKSILGFSILRIPEMYFIMAEYYMKSDPEKAEEYFDAVTATRGLDSLKETGTALTEDRLFNERRKEFYGEGFTWHEMKREGKDIVTTYAGTIDGSDYSHYTLPRPESEDEARANLY